MIYFLHSLVRFGEAEQFVWFTGHCQKERFAPIRTIMGLLSEGFHIVVDTKYVTLYVAAIFLLAVAGCMSSFKHTTYEDGFDFNSENVKKIVIGKTTGKELIQMFGGRSKSMGFPKMKSNGHISTQEVLNSW